ncbi:TPA: hypothetical protein VDZ55_000138 [Streptococcus pyogenes]|nr:hypothetical protein [Streptococcus pyogenes]
MVTKEQLNKYYSEHLDDLVEWADDIDKVCLFAYLDEDDNLYSGINQLSYTQFRVPIQAEVVVDNDWNDDFFNNPSDYDGWDETLEEMLEELND